MAVLATDNFNRANQAPLSGNWTATGGTGFNLTSNAVVPGNTVNDAYGYYNAVTWPNDHYSKVKVTTTKTGSGGEGAGVCVRQHSTIATETRYRLVFTVDHAELAKQVAGSYTLIWNRATTFVSGNTVELDAQGTTLRAYNNGSQIGANSTDSSIASGNAGLFYSSQDTSAVLDDWEGGDFGSSATPVSLTASATGTPSYMRSVGRLMSVTGTGTKTISRSIALARSLTSTATPVFVRRAGRIMASSATGTSALSVSRKLLAAISAGATGTASFVRTLGRKIATSATGTASFVRSIGRNMAVLSSATPLFIRSIAPILVAAATVTASVTASVIAVGTVFASILMSAEGDSMGIPLRIVHGICSFSSQGAMNITAWAKHFVSVAFSAAGFLTARIPRTLKRQTWFFLDNILWWRHRHRR